MRAISRRKKEPEFLLKWRLAAFERWSAMSHPAWGKLRIEPIDFQALSYYSAPKSMNAQTDGPKSLADVDPKLLETYEKLGVPLHERARLAGVTGVAVDAVFDSVSVGTTFREQLAQVGVIFCSFSHAVQHHPGPVSYTHLCRAASGTSRRSARRRPRRPRWRLRRRWAGSG